MRVHRRSFVLGIAAGLLFGAAEARASERVLVFAASSMREVMETAAARFAETGGGTIEFSFAGSGALARQIDAGAHAEIFVSADPVWIDSLTAAGLLDPQSRVTLAANALVMVAASGSAPVDLEPAAIAERLGDGRIALGEARSVPAGAYARQSLEALGLWDSLAGRTAEVENVRVALSLVARGEAALAIVYATDAGIEPGVSVVASIPDETHAPILYDAALTLEAGPGAAAFLGFLAGPEGLAVFRDAGFREPPVAR
jgi:molybdate transport system substrate-binding protein